MNPPGLARAKSKGRTSTYIIQDADFTNLAVMV
jgi:hypothetical protein